MEASSPERFSLLDAITGKGYRLTAQRRLLIEIIQQAEDYHDAATLLETARRRAPDIHRATVYRTLDLLKKLRLVDELDLMHLNGEKHYYEAKPRRDHMHLVCLECGQIREFASPTFERLKEEIARQNGFDIGVIRLEVGGRCSACRAKEKRGAAAV